MNPRRTSIQISSQMQQQLPPFLGWTPAIPITTYNTISSNGSLWNTTLQRASLWWSDRPCRISGSIFKSVHYRLITWRSARYLALQQQQYLKSHNITHTTTPTGTNHSTWSIHLTAVTTIMMTTTYRLTSSSSSSWDRSSWIMVGLGRSRMQPPPRLSVGTVAHDRWRIARNKAEAIVKVAAARIYSFRHFSRMPFTWWRRGRQEEEAAAAVAIAT